jgi:hypothetical protein
MQRQCAEWAYRDRNRITKGKPLGVDLGCLIPLKHDLSGSEVDERIARLGEELARERAKRIEAERAARLLLMLLQRLKEKDAAGRTALWANLRAAAQPCPGGRNNRGKSGL